jgi:hypothetical protein
MNAKPGIFPTFFLSGFECSTFLWKDQGRRDLCEETKHRVHADEDYAMLRPLGIAVAREGIPWPMVDRGGGLYDFSYIDPFIQAMRRHKILPIWDLCPLRLSGRHRSLRTRLCGALRRLCARGCCLCERGP